MKQNPEKFAYGKDQIGDYCCPAVAAGFAPDTADESTVAAEWYDSAVDTLGFRNADAVISENEARRAWLWSVDQLEWADRFDDDTAEVAVEVGREIAEELGWQ